MILRDPVHGLIAFESPDDIILERLLEAREVQRLRRIRQLGLTSLAYPGAEHTRFAHALGAAHVMKRLALRLGDIDHALPQPLRLDPVSVRDALAAALLHDIGHGPLSHMFEGALPHCDRHEAWTLRIILDPSTDVHRILSGHDSGMPDRVASLISGKHRLTYLSRAISGTYDVDRCDYLLRDAHATGVRYGNFDLEWFHRSMRFAPVEDDAVAPPLAIDGAKGLAAIESFVLARLFMFQQVYFHKATRAAEWMVRHALSRAVQLVRDGAALPAVPAAFRSAAAGREPSMDEYLALDDHLLDTTLHAWADAHDCVLSQLCKRIRSRQLFKTIDLDSDICSDPKRQERVLAIASSLAQSHGLEPSCHVGLDLATDTPFDDSKDPLVVVFNNAPPTRPAQVSFLLGRLNGEALTRVRLIVPPEIRDDVSAAIAP